MGKNTRVASITPILDETIFSETNAVRGLHQSRIAHEFGEAAPLRKCARQIKQEGCSNVFRFYSKAWRVFVSVAALSANSL